MKKDNLLIASKTSRIHPLLAAVVFFGSFILYWQTAARYPGWVDAAWILSSARNLELGVWANVHSLFNILGFLWLRLFHGTDPHYALTLFCSLLGSLTVLFVYLTGVALTVDPVASLLTSVALTLSLSLWWHSTTIEVYTLNTLLIAFFMFSVFKAYRLRKPGFLYAAFFTAGLGISNHVLMALYVFAFFAVLLPLSAKRFHLKVRNIIFLILVYLAGATLYAVLFIIRWSTIYRGMGPGFGGFFESFAATFNYAMGGPFLDSMFTSGLESRQKLFWRINYIFLILLNFPSPALIFIILGFPAFWKRKEIRPVFLFYIVGITAQILWSANYFIWDMYAFALPVYVMLAVPLVLGTHNFLVKRKTLVWAPVLLVLFLVPVFLYPSFARWPNREKTVDRYMSMYPESERTGGIWDPAEYIFNPVKRSYDKAAMFCEGVLKILPTGAAYWDDESKGAYPMEYYYQDIMGRRLDVDINRIFGLIMNDEDAEQHARTMLDQLRKNQRVFLSGIVEPQREILNRLYVTLSKEASLEQVRDMDRATFIENFPDYRIEEVPLVDDGSMVIYQLKKRS